MQNYLEQKLRWWFLSPALCGTKWQNNPDMCSDASWAVRHDWHSLKHMRDPVVLLCPTLILTSDTEYRAPTQVLPQLLPLSRSSPYLLFFTLLYASPPPHRVCVCVGRTVTFSQGEIQHPLRLTYFRQSDSTHPFMSPDLLHSALSFFLSPHFHRHNSLKRSQGQHTTVKFQGKKKQKKKKCTTLPHTRNADKEPQARVKVNKWLNYKVLSLSNWVPEDPPYSK